MLLQGRVSIDREQMFGVICAIKSGAGGRWLGAKGGRLWKEVRVGVRVGWGFGDWGWIFWGLRVVGGLRDWSWKLRGFTYKWLARERKGHLRIYGAMSLVSGGWVGDSVWVGLGGREGEAEGITWWCFLRKAGASPTEADKLPLHSTRLCDYRPTERLRK